MKRLRLPSRRRIREKVRRLSFNTKLFLLQFPGIPIAVYYGAAKAISPSHAKAVRYHAPRLAARIVLYLNRVRVSVRNREQLAKIPEGPLVIFTNHNSRMDSYILHAYLPFSFRSFWSNESHTFKDRLRGLIWFGRKFDLFYMHDKSDAMATVAEFRRAKAFLRDGGILSFFPEGKMHSDRTILMTAFGDSCLSAAIEAGATVLPIVLANTEYSFEFRRRGVVKPVVMAFCQPFSTTGRRKGEAYELTQALQSQMLEAYNALLGGSAFGRDNFRAPALDMDRALGDLP